MRDKIMKYKHNKTGDIYRHLAFATDCTNSRDGTGVIIYCKDDNEHSLFVRDIKEFDQKFSQFQEDLENERAGRIFKNG